MTSPVHAPDDLSRWLWSPLGSAGRAAVVDQLPRVERWASMAGPLRQQHRCSFDLAGRRVSVDWRGAPLVATVDRTAAVTCEAYNGSGPGAFVWPYQLPAVRVLGEEITTERESSRRRGRRRLPGVASPWQLAVRGPRGWAWTWATAGGPVFADRLELRRAGEPEPVVEHLLRPVPGRPGRPDGTEPEVRWTAAAVPVEVLVDVLWVVLELYSGILPTAQRVARADIL